jgi:hypothetical protein
MLQNYVCKDDNIDPRIERYKQKLSRGMAEFKPWELFKSEC